MSNPGPHHLPSDRPTAAVFGAREDDWRVGAVVYQVLVDRFAPSADLDAKRALYPPPKVLRPWAEVPVRGRYLDRHRVWSHELDFWGGDLASTAARLDHVQRLGADVLYLNPVFLAWTNHKYDTLDHTRLSPEFGTQADLQALAEALHSRGLKMVLDGVFNHMGRRSPTFQEAEADPASPLRDWFYFDEACAGGARCWWRAENLPELNLENPDVRRHLFAGLDSVVRRQLRDGADGWRLDVAHDIGLVHLAELTRAAHDEKPGSLIVGEVANYPAQWLQALDGVMLFTLRRLTLMLAAGDLDAASYGRMLQRLVDDCGIEPLLRSWFYLDNHDTPRLASVLPEERSRRLAQVLQFTLPGSPNLYYGSEVDMTGTDDPENRAPMRWDLIEAGHGALAWVQRLITLRRAHRALRIGDYRAVLAQHLFAFERCTERVADTVIVVVNPSDRQVDDILMVPDARLMDGTLMLDLLGTAGSAPLYLSAALLRVSLPPRSAWVLGLQTEPPGGYSPYKRA